MNYICNAFSFNMLPQKSGNISFMEVSVEEASSFAQAAESRVGHDDASCFYSTLLGCEVPVNRAETQLEAGDQLLIGMFRVPRLQEGAVIDKEATERRWLIITVH